MRVASRQVVDVGCWVVRFQWEDLVVVGHTLKVKMVQTREVLQNMSAVAGAETVLSRHRVSIQAQF